MDRIDVLGDSSDRLDLFTKELLAEANDSELQEIVKKAAIELNSPIALVSLVLDQVQFFKAHIGLPPVLESARGTHRDVSFCQFVVRDGKLITPELTSCLEGITRDSIFVLAREMGLSIYERRITRDEVYIADEAFFTGTAAEVVPIRELDGRTIGSGQRGPITEQLQKKYFGAVRGTCEEHSDWLAPVTS